MTDTGVKRITRKEILKKYKKKTPAQEILGRFLANRLAIVGIIIFAAILFTCVFADLFANYQIDALKMNVPERLQGPSAKHLFGTDEMGRDVFARVIFGGRTSLWIGFVATAFSLLVGGLLGAVAGYFGGKFDEIIMRIMDVMLCLPEILLAIAIVAAFGTNIVNMIIAIGLSRVPRFARIVRSAVLTVRDTDYVEAARAIGATNSVIIVRHVLANCLAPIIVQVTLIFASAILAISSLSFLGVGVPAPQPSWGNILAEGREVITKAWWMVVYPGLATALAVMGTNIFGDGLRDILDPHTN